MTSSRERGLDTGVCFTGGSNECKRDQVSVKWNERHIGLFQDYL